MQKLCNKSFLLKDKKKFLKIKRRKNRKNNKEIKLEKKKN